MISLFLCNSFTILFEFKHDEFEREQEGTGILGVEPAPREEPAPVANLRGPFADVQARCSLFLVSCSGDFDEKHRLAGLV